MLYFDAAVLKSFSLIVLTIFACLLINFSFLSISNKISDKLYSYFFLFDIFKINSFLVFSLSILTELLYFIYINSFHNPSYFTLVSKSSNLILFFVNKLLNCPSSCTLYLKKRFFFKLSINSSLFVSLNSLSNSLFFINSLIKEFSDIFIISFSFSLLTTGLKNIK